jgi:ATP-dependent RNA helicase DDX5/DBP2
MPRREDETESEYAARKASKKAKKLSAAADAEATAAPKDKGEKRARKASMSEPEAKASTAAPVARRPRTRSETSLAEMFAAPSAGAAASSSSSSSSDAARAAAFCKEHNVRITAPPGFSVPAPMDTFESVPFSAKQLALCTVAGFTAPTLTQAVSWPLALTGSNIVSVAKTGSGKTLGFLLPVFHCMAKAGVAHAPLPLPAAGARPGFAPSGRPPTLLVVAPTRELACQIEVDAAKFGRVLGLRSTCVYGGAPKGPQCRAVREGLDAVIGTPGRIQDLVEMRVLVLDGVRFLVLDEADRMLDMGFEESIRAIVGRVRADRQTLLFSATWPRQVQRLASEFCPAAVQVSLGDTDTLTANPDIKQIVEVVGGADAKVARLREVFTRAHMTGEGGKVDEAHGKTIVFVKFKANCGRIAQDLWDAGFAVNTLHGDMEQRERDKVIGEFRASKIRVLVATDVAARGLDVKDIQLVVNFDMAGTVEDYVHRIGRTGRAGKSGTSHTFIDPAADRKTIAELVDLLKKAKQDVPEELGALVRGRGGGGGGGGGRRFGGGGGGGRFGGGGGRGGFRGGRGGKW